MKKVEGWKMEGKEEGSERKVKKEEHREGSGSGRLKSGR